MHKLKRTIRRALAYALYYSGLLWVYAELRLRRRAVVLMYHRVLPTDADTFSHPGIIVSPAAFDLQMAFLARHFRVLTQAQFKRELSASAFAPRACLVTFDDGWQDNLTHALPVLQKHRVPVIVFIATGYIGTTDTFWQERLTRLLCLAACRDGFDARMLRDLGFEGRGELGPQRVRLLAREFVTSLKTREPAVVQQLLQSLQAALSDLPESRNLGADQFMGWEDVATLIHSGLVTIGSHGHSHTRLTTLGYKGARKELEASRQELNSHGIAEILACAYPNGDVTDPVEAAASDAGFALGFSTKGGLVAHSSEATHIRRVNIHDADCRSRPEFLYRLLGLP